MTHKDNESGIKDKALFGPVWSRLAPFCPLWPSFDPFGPFWPSFAPSFLNGVSKLPNCNLKIYVFSLSQTSARLKAEPPPYPTPPQTFL